MIRASALGRATSRGKTNCRRRNSRVFQGALAAMAVTLALGAAGQTRVIELRPRGSEIINFDTDVASAFVADEETADVMVFNERKIAVLGRATGRTKLEVYDQANEVIATFDILVQAQKDFANTVVERLVGDNSSIQVDSVGDALFVSGQAENPSQAERVMTSIKAVSGDTPVVNGISLANPAQVNLEVVISEVSKNVTQELGIDWSLDINPFTHPLRTLVTAAGLRPGNPVFTGVRLGSGATNIAPVWNFTARFPDGSEQTTRELGVQPGQRGGDGGIVLTHSKEINSGKYRATSFLEALAENGLAVVHARPNLTCLSGESCSTNSGAQIPVPVATADGVVAADYRPTGVTLTFMPVVLDNDMIELTVESAITEITTGGTNISGAFVPNINQRGISTKVTVGDSESIAIAGLYRNTTSSSESGIPLLKDIPVWGALFRTTRESKRSVELIVVVTANIVGSVRSVASTDLQPSPTDTARRFGNEYYY